MEYCCKNFCHNRLRPAQFSLTLSLCLIFSEVGAHFLETVVRQFDKTYSQLDATDKECDNLVSIIGHLYNFHVVHALLVFDILKKLVTRFSSKDIELVLLVLKNVGFTLRKDDPLALKELISEAQRKASSEGERFQDQTRVRLICLVKNLSSSAYDHIIFTLNY